MLGRYVRVKVLHPFHSIREDGFVYPLNYGVLEKGQPGQMAYIMGIQHPVSHFDGRVIGVLRHKQKQERIWIVAPKSTRFIVNDIRNYLDMEGAFSSYTLDCLYESSCGAVVFHRDNGCIRFLLIKNKRSAHWGYPKGHIEPGETKQETARREVLEETGVHIKILDHFQSKSEYKIQGRIEKTVTIFLAETQSDAVKLQEEEIDAYAWHTYESALRLLRFENDKAILRGAYRFLRKRGYLRSK